MCVREWDIYIFTPLFLCVGYTSVCDSVTFENYACSDFQLPLQGIHPDPNEASDSLSGGFI